MRVKKGLLVPEGRTVGQDDRHMLSSGYVERKARVCVRTLGIHGVAEAVAFLAKQDTNTWSPS